MVKKILSLVLIISVLASILLCGCTKKTEYTTEGSASADATSAPATTEVKKEPTVITILGQDTYDPNWPLSKGLPVIQELEKRTNVKLEFQSIPQSTQIPATVQTRLAAGADLPDLVQLFGGGGIPELSLYNIGKQGVLLEIGSLMDKYAPNMAKVYKEYPAYKDWITAPDGKMYYFNYVNISKPEESVGIWLRKDWLDKAGITKLPETTDEFFNALKTMQDKDVNGNSKKDEVFLPFQWWQFEWTLPGAFGLTGCEWNVDANGKVFFGRLSAQYKDFLMLCNKIFAAGLTDPEVVNIPWDKYYAKHQTNIVMGSANCSRALEWNKTNSDSGNSEIVYLPVLNAENGGLCTKGYWGGGFWGVTRGCKNIEAVMKFLDYLYSPEGEMLYKYGIENVHYTKGADGKISRTKEYLEGIAKDPDHYGSSQGFGYGTALPYKSVQTTEEFIVLNGDSYKKANVDPQYLRDIVSMYEKSAVDQYPHISYNEEESKQDEAIGTDWKKYVDEMVIKFFMGKESFGNWDAFVKKANELGAEKAAALQQSAYDRYKSRNK